MAAAVQVVSTRVVDTCTAVQVSVIMMMMLSGRRNGGCRSTSHCSRRCRTTSIDGGATTSARIASIEGRVVTTATVLVQTTYVFVHLQDIGREMAARVDCARFKTEIATVIIGNLIQINVFLQALQRLALAEDAHFLLGIFVNHWTHDTPEH